VTDVLPLTSLVHVVPDLVGGGVEEPMAQLCQPSARLSVCAGSLCVRRPVMYPTRSDPSATPRTSIDIRVIVDRSGVGTRSSQG
jgi:hypothetical protein